MAHEAVSTPLARQRFSFGIMDAVFVALLLLAFVGMQPFALRNPATDLQTSPYQMTGSGDAIRQVFYLLIFASVVVAAFLRRGFAIATIVPPMLTVLLGWCLLSAVWAAAPDIALRRAGLAIVVALSAMFCIDSLGVERSLKLWRYVLAGVLIVNWLSIAFVHQAVHLPGEQDPGLVGNWRGLYFHKNIAGAVSAITAILFFFQALKERPLLNGAFCAGAIGFTIMTVSKSSIGLLPLAIAAGYLYARIWRRGIDRAIAGTALLLITIACALILATHQHAILHALNDPTELTGRTAIWIGEFSFIRDHPLLGAGFGSFADTGAASLLHAYVADKWVQNISHGHNAYLQMLVTIGLPGFALAILVFLLAPACAFWRFDPARAGIKAVLVAIFVFMVLHNFLES